MEEGTHAQDGGDDTNNSKVSERDLSHGLGFWTPMEPVVKSEGSGDTQVGILKEPGYIQIGNSTGQGYENFMVGTRGSVGAPKVHNSTGIHVREVGNEGKGQGSYGVTADNINANHTVEKTSSNAGTYANVVKGKSKVVNFLCFITMNGSRDESIDVMLPKEGVRESSKQYTFTLYGYFIVQRVAFPVVQIML